jgi:hypothetical protein
LHATSLHQRKQRIISPKQPVGLPINSRRFQPAATKKAK